MQREIGPREWRSFFDHFSRRHEGWLVTLECDRIGYAFRDLPLRGVAVDERTIEIFAHGPDGAHIAHVVRHPVRVISDETAEGGDVAVTIVNAEGHRTVIEFRSAVPVEMVNGVAASATTGGER
jgi:hypothetical protein